MSVTLKVERLSFEVHGKRLLSDVSLELSDGDFVLLAGSNGAGKTTLLKCIALLESDWSGDILFQQRSIRDMDRMQRAKAIAYLPQRLDSLPDFSVRHFMKICRYAWQDNDEAPILEAAETLGIVELLERHLTTLSGGELQKVLVASALAQKPHLMLLDEPTASLDPVQKLEIASLLRKLAKDMGIAILMVSHDVQVCAKYVDYVLPMRNGSLLAMQSPDDFLAKIDDVYRSV
ncbi:MAG: ABC transporter ATP-binding protein [Victivallales bacterium]|nr:ABC transporter ATP-binding protein [Victivallales bacterium]